MEGRINNVKFFDHAMHKIDPDLQMRMNVPDRQIIPGDEFNHYTNSFRNTFTYMSLYSISLKKNFLRLQINITDTVKLNCRAFIIHLVSINNHSNKMSHEGGVCLFKNNKRTVFPKPELFLSIFL